MHLVFSFYPDFDRLFNITNKCKDEDKKLGQNSNDNSLICYMKPLKIVIIKNFELFERNLVKLLKTMRKNL